MKFRLRIWQNSHNMKTCTPLHSPTRDSSCRTTSDILKHFLIFRYGALNRKDTHKVNHHHLNALCLTERCLSKTTVAHVFFPESFVYKTFSSLLFQITLLGKPRSWSYLVSIFLDQMVCYLSILEIVLRPQSGHHCIPLRWQTNHERYVGLTWADYSFHSFSEH